MGAHLHSTAASDITLQYWRKNQHEVDFVLQRSRRVVAIEAHCLKWDATERSALRNEYCVKQTEYQQLS